MVLVPTATYLSYANSRFWWEEPILSEAVHDRLVELGPDDQYLMLHEELGPSSYDVHDDGTDVTHVSSRQPNLFMRTTNRHFEGYVSDLFLIDWLEHVGADYEVATDADLHAGGARLLDDVTVVITGTHPEYVSEREFDALAQFQGNGGRVMYLGGNGFQSRVTFNPDRPHIMESRRVPYWKSRHVTASAEHHLASDGILGGHLSAIGCEARLLVGVETATMGFDESVPFWRVSDLPDAVSFVFRDVHSDRIGGFGLIGGGVVGQEWDNSAGGELPDGHTVLAVSRDHSMILLLFGSVREPYHAEMVLVTRDGGGACFSCWKHGLVRRPPAGRVQERHRTHHAKRTQAASWTTGHCRAAFQKCRAHPTSAGKCETRSGRLRPEPVFVCVRSGQPHGTRMTARARLEGVLAAARDRPSLRRVGDVTSFKNSA